VIYINIEKAKSVISRIIALFLVSALTTIGAGAIIGIDTLQTAILAGVMGVANVLEDLSRGYLNDGELSHSEINAAFRKNTPAQD
jgi:hypothetical protein